jgi:hypothetical protein
MKNNVIFIIVIIILIILIIITIVWIYLEKRDYDSCISTEKVICPTYTCYHTPENIEDNNLSAYRFYGKPNAIKQLPSVGGIVK